MNHQSSDAASFCKTQLRKTVSIRTQVNFCPGVLMSACPHMASMQHNGIEALVMLNVITSDTVYWLV